MVVIHTTSKLYNTLHDVMENIKPVMQKQLVSITTKVDNANSFAFYQAGTTNQGTRFYWASADRTLTLVGIGETVAFESDDNGFDAVHHSFGQLLENAAIYNDYEASGTGPIAFGGFAFDPLKEGSVTWGDFPNSSMVIPTYLLTIVHQESYLTINALVEPGESLEPYIAQSVQFMESTFQREQMPYLIQQEEVAPEEWKQIVKDATEDIKRGVIDKVVLAREMIATFSENIPISSLLNVLSEQQHQSYIFAFERGMSCFVGSTPERLVKVEQRSLLSTCLAGTISRGQTQEEDEQLGSYLLHDEKNLQEHDFVVQMIKQAVELCCDDVVVPDGPILYPLRNLQHLYTPVKGKLQQGYTILDVVQRLHPTPALGGYPVEASIEFIRDKEPFHRGWYAAPIGWFDPKDNGEFAVAIRSALLYQNQATLFAGCGVVEDSQPEVEYEETAIKFSPMLQALGGLQ
ncbi:isochorismate synthase [Pontibacillus litoralis JSM 072002]|uniref:Isochorismate synthase MenF n=1 Tax=Pontibacillus litoralis JSM 072002 TaxID=1385512 RepID=A0A0A5G0V9_9BACI|nr:isochorismate synthase [Pontibacillus litoralis JSM 072002]